ncbi:hypothetical protein [Paenibacillus wulumuqiensis]|uniref:hypothetical protein n=1 Tax=Paenibacillus wulumuqiensis TaxID=1567107 RepID=UPI0006193189|nr:hypothetical protein [Paenibacillus wulumuqiensis]
MPHDTQHVSYGYEPPVEKFRGTLIFYDSFENTTDEELAEAAAIADRMHFDRLVLYPLHEQTVKRMSKAPVSPFYKREDRLHEWRRDTGRKDIIIENWEGKRKKYTPIEAALRTLIDHYASPYFLLMTPEMANLFASFSTFEEWIVKVSLVLTKRPSHLHPRLEKYASRWRVAGEQRDQDKESQS